MSEWPEATLGEMAVVVMGQSPAGAECNRVGEGWPLLNGPTEFGLRHPRAAQWTNAPTKWAEPGDVLFCVRGSTTGRMNVADQKYVIGRGIAAIRSRNAGLTPFVHQAVQWKLSALLSLTTGSTFPNLSRESIAGLTLPNPPVEDQRRIAEVLGALDDLIDTNERLGRRLTDLAGAKGQSLLAALDDGTSATIDDVASIAKGYSYKSAELTEGTGWLVGLKNVGRRGEFRADGFKPLNAAVKPSQVVENGDLVVAHTDLTQAREVIGRPVRVRRGNRSGTLVASLDLVVVRPNADVSVEYLQAVLESPAFREHALGYCNGTTVLHMNSRAVPSFPVAVPSVDQMRTFDELTPLRAAADDAFEAADQLRRTRDELLPLLMSGKVRVRPKEVAA